MTWLVCIDCLRWSYQNQGLVRGNLIKAILWLCWPSWDNCRRSSWYEMVHCWNGGYRGCLPFNDLIQCLRSSAQFAESSTRSLHTTSAPLFKIPKLSIIKSWLHSGHEMSSFTSMKKLRHMLVIVKIVYHHDGAVKSKDHWTYLLSLESWTKCRCMSVGLPQPGNVD